MDKLRIQECRGSGMRLFESKDAIGEFQHFEILLVMPPGPLRYFEYVSERNIHQLQSMAESLAAKTHKPVLSITVVISWANQDEFERNKLPEAEESEGKETIHEIIATVGKWGKIIKSDGPLKELLVNTRVYPLQETEVILEHIYPKDDTDGVRMWSM